MRVGEAVVVLFGLADLRNLGPSDSLHAFYTQTSRKNTKTLVCKEAAHPGTRLSSLLDVGLCLQLFWAKSHMRLRSVPPSTSLFSVVRFFALVSFLAEGRHLVSGADRNRSTASTTVWQNARKEKTQSSYSEVMYTFVRICASFRVVVLCGPLLCSRAFLSGGSPPGQWS